MAESALETVLKRDRAVGAGSLVLLTALAWAYLSWLSANLPAAPSAASMPGMIMLGSGMPGGNPWNLPSFLCTLAMWAVMMVGMMTPSAAPMILLYARVGRQARSEAKPFAATGWFAGGYLLAWWGFALAASLAQASLAGAGLLTPMLASAGGLMTGLLLVGAGAYELTALKNSCLSQCQAPLQFLQRQGGFRRDAAGALRLGLKHGLFCIGCCWALMALLFVGGVMNLLWVAALSILVLLEKIVPAGRTMPLAAGLVMIAGGAIYLYRAAM